MDASDQRTSVIALGGPFGDVSAPCAAIDAAPDAAPALEESAWRPVGRKRVGGMKNFNAIGNLPEVSAAVLSDGSGTLLEWSGSIDGETAAAVHAFSLQALTQAGELLGLGGLDRTVVQGPSKACIITVQGEEILGVYASPGKAFIAVEKKLETALQK